MAALRICRRCVHALPATVVILLLPCETPLPDPALQARIDVRARPLTVRLHQPGSMNQRDVGLCDSCAHARVVESDRGSRFYLCQLASTDRRFRKYPSLPVVQCLGYQAQEITR
jgi:hypothetical protein